MGRGRATEAQINNVDHAHATTFNVISFEAPRACAGAKQSLDRANIAGDGDGDSDVGITVASKLKLGRQALFRHIPWRPRHCR